MDDLIVEFITETNESLDELDMDLVNLEQNPNDKDLLSKIFRLMHTIKGTCGFLSLPRLEKVAHHAENVLGRFRDGELEVTANYVTLIFESIDRIKYIVGEIEQTGAEPEGSDEELISKLDAAYEGKEVDVGAEKEPEPEPEKDLPPGEVSIDELEAAFAAAPGMDGIVNAKDLEEEAQSPGGESAEASEDEGDKDSAQADADAEEEKKAAAPAPKKPEKQEPPKATEKPEGKPMTTQTLRVNVDVLENLMTMVSELVLTRNQLLQIVRAHGETEFSAPLQRLNHVVSDLQEGVMKTRMQPIGNAWSKLPRIIRDLAIELDKKIELDMKGQDTELDRQVLEMIKDPLTHMVRNSGDHGIEKPEDRVAAGKPETGKILLEAYHEGGHIIIKIADDGKGLSEDKIKEKILNNGLATAEELEEMSTQQIQQFIFKAGFSTAEAVTSVSGRGVGMDVVRTNIEKIGGSIELKSTEGKGSTFIIKIPLTLAIVSALIVEAAGERFAIPQLSVRELVMVSDHGENRIEYIKGAPVFRLRDRLLPLVALNDILNLDDGETLEEIRKFAEDQETIEADKRASYENADDAAALEGDDDIVSDEETEKSAASANGHKRPAQEKPKTESRNLYIVIAQVGGYEFGIIVDRVFDTEEIVVKPVAHMLKDLQLFSGNTILGDGSVIMILDPNGIANATGNIDTTDTQDAAHKNAIHRADSDKKTSLLLFNVGDKTPKAVPLSLIARLENVKLSDIEYSSGQMMVQYRDTLMPLVPFNSSIQVGAEGDKPVLVFADKERSMGIIVEEIVDIMEEHIDVKVSSSQAGLLGSAIINGHATDVVDIAHFLNNINSSWFQDHDDTPYGEDPQDGKRKKRVLLVDDSPFFRNMLTPLLSVAGYEVTTLESPAEALQLCEDGVIFDVIISDIEMPEMDGFEFAQHVKSSDSTWSDTPMVALSSHATPQDVERGRSVGFNNYVAKFDKETLLSTLSKTLTTGS